MKDNKLIAEFMGGEHPLAKVTHEAHHNYDTSWDWLMPVVRQVLTSIDIDWIDYDDDELKFNVLDCDISGVHKEVVEFIKIYNNDTNR